MKHNRITPKDWEESLFSQGTYNKTSATGQKVFGSMNDYYKEQSFGKLKVEGKIFDCVQVGKKRVDYAQAPAEQDRTCSPKPRQAAGPRRQGLPARISTASSSSMPATACRRTAAGSTGRTGRTSRIKGKRWPYFIVQEGGTKMSDISVFCHEFGHMLGLPDLYARPENPGSEGVGVWCAMSNQVGGGKPQHFCAWSKEQLGWIKPAVIDPTVKQKLILSPIEDSPKECFKVLVRPDGSEYFLLENRKKKGFDSQPARPRAC